MAWPVIEFRLRPGEPWQTRAQWGGKPADGIASALRLKADLREQGYPRALVRFNGKNITGEGKEKK